MIQTAIILAGGKGERLRPYTDDKPKVMVEIAGKPILLWQINWLKSHGICKFIITLSYKYEVVQDFFRSGKKFGIEIDYSIEEQPLGRGGAIKKAFGSPLAKNEENVVVTNGDIITKMNLLKMMNFHEKNQALVTQLVIPYLSRWGIVEIDPDDHVTGFKEKPQLPYWINGGIYVFNKDTEPLLPKKGDHEQKTFPKLKKERYFAFKDMGFWRAVDVVKDKTEAEEFLLKGKSKLS
ncbi:nucleotidyltransferase family protein [Candidatus Daviesbacteria bacterium]|nr:nucleotidyltransferase family protein [Candidatus Daviesbacteria bacterium]